MDYEKKYNETLAKMREWKKKYVDSNILSADGTIIKNLYDIFPELAESEDERIRKAIIATIEQCQDDFLEPKNRGRMLAYLEKQKDEAQKQFNLGVQAGREEVLYEMEKEQNAPGYKTDDYFCERCQQNAFNAGKEAGLKEQKPNQSEDEKEYVRTLKSLISDFLRGKDEIDRGYYQKIYDWLDGRNIEQKSAEWSEEDEAAFGDLMWCIEQARKSAKDENDMGNVWFAENWVKNRLKSLRPQPNWKPSEEQMRAVFEASERNDKLGYVLRNLYNELKKRM